MKYELNDGYGMDTLTLNQKRMREIFIDDFYLLMIWITLTFRTFPFDIIKKRKIYLSINLHFWKVNLK
jgi:hypothetical protein